MPYASQETIDRVTNVLLRGNHAMKRAVLRETPINPPHGSTSMFDEALKTRAFTKLKITDTADMICFIRFGAVDRDQVGALTFITRTPQDLPTTASRAGWIPCWFLPWTSGHMIKMKIASAATSPVLNLGPGIDPVPNPDLFFTAGINGCSVFAVGTADMPSVYHGGIDPGSGLTMPLQPNETTEMAWQRLVGRAGGVKYVGSVGKHDYVTELNNAATTDDGDRLRDPGGRTTRLAMDLQTRLNATGQLTRVSVSPWGAVFGLRDPATNAWQMTLVQNATAVYQRIVVKTTKRFLRSDKVVTQHVGEARPNMGLMRTPDGLADLTRGNGDPTMTDCATVANLGYKEFFPAGGVASVRAVDLTQVY
jgi:hypothetical protein